MNVARFKAWLARRKKPGPRPKADIVYRCLRVERIFSVDLDDLTTVKEAESLDEKIFLNSGNLCQC
jgi:hypothetical protein